MYQFLAFLRDPEQDLLKAGGLFSFLANLIRESSPLISNIFKFFSFILKFFSSSSNLIFIFLIIGTGFLIFLIFYIKKKKKKKLNLKAKQII